MKFQRILEAVHFRPWLITPRAHASIVSLIETRMNEAVKEPVSRVRTERPTEDLFGNSLPVMSVEDGVAFIPICGVIGNKLGVLEKTCGAVGIEDISADVSEAIADPSVKAIFLDIQSPGGTVGGLPELATEIMEASKVKKIMAFTDSDMCSAAYWLGSSANLLFASPSSEVGSIGVYLPWVDQTAAYAMEGLKVDLIKNKDGKYKGAGYPGTALSQDQRDQLQAGVDQVFAMFKAHVLQNRNVENEAMQGQTFMGEEAKRVGLIDQVMTRSEAINYLTAYASKTWIG